MGALLQATCRVSRWLKASATVFLGFAVPIGASLADVAYNPAQGWNLLGNASDQSVDVATYLGDSSKVTSVWRWNTTQAKWAFYSPSLSSPALASYAQANGYIVLNQLNPKEGFWVNAVKSFSFTLPSTASQTLSESELLQGWNLVGSADNKTPSKLSQELASSLSAAGKSDVSYWTWSAAAGKWRFYAPSLEKTGELNAYVTSNSYTAFASPVSSTEGLWVNVSGGSATTSLFSQPANPLNLKLTLDARSAAFSATVTSAGGGTLTAQATDGTAFRLDIPAGALTADTLITMTPVSTISNLPLNSLGGAVKLEPEGLFFLQDAILTITPKVAIPIANQVMFGFSASGQDTVLATPAQPYGSSIQISLQHFSGAGVGNGVSAQKAAILNSIADRAESRLASEMGAVLSRAREDALNGGTGLEGMDKLIELMNEYDETVVKTRLDAAMAASGSCGDATKASQTLLGHERQRALLGLPQSSSYGQAEALLTSGNAKCREEKIKECQAKSEPGILKSFDFGVARQQALLGISDGASSIYSDAYYEETCGAGVWTGTTKFVAIDKGGMQWHHTATVTFSLDKSASTANKQVFAVKNGTVNLEIPSGPVSGGCTLAGGSNSTPLTADDGSLTIDLASNTYQGSGYLSAARLPLIITFSCPKIAPFSYDAGVDTAWFWADDAYRPLAPDGKSFQGTRTMTGNPTINAEWSFTRQ